MWVKVATMYEDGGRALPRHRAISVRPQHEGIYSLREGHDRELRRSVRTAHLRSLDGREDVLPTLYDAVVLYTFDGIMRVTGFEKDPITHKATAQSWHIEIQNTAAPPRGGIEQLAGSDSAAAST